MTHIWRHQWRHIPPGVKKTDFTGFSYITRKVAWLIVKIQIGAWLFLCFFASKGYVECRKAQLIQAWPIYGVKLKSHAPKVLKKTDFTGFSYITRKVARSIVKIQTGAWLFLCLFAPKGYVECRKAQLIHIWPIHGVKMTSKAPWCEKDGFHWFLLYNMKSSLAHCQDTDRCLALFMFVCS